MPFTIEITDTDTINVKDGDRTMGAVMFFLSTDKWRAWSYSNLVADNGEFGSMREALQWVTDNDPQQAADSLGSFFVDC